MASGRRDEARKGQANKAIGDAYRQCLEARRVWISVNSRSFDPSVKQTAHAELHEAVMAWWETLRTYLSTAQGSAHQYWTRAPLWRTERAYEQTLGCMTCQMAYDGDEFDGKIEAGDSCQNVAPDENGHLVDCPGTIEVVEVPAEGEDGEALYHYEQGLQSVGEYIGRTEVVHQTSGTFKPTTEVVERPLLLDPEKLLKIARYLDEAAKELDLLAQTKKVRNTVKA